MIASNFANVRGTTTAAGNSTVFTISVPFVCVDNLDLHIEDLIEAHDRMRKLNELRKKAEEDWKRFQELREEFCRIGEKLEAARYACEVFRLPPKKLGRGREPKKWDHRRPQRTTKARQKRPRRRR